MNHVFNRLAVHFYRSQHFIVRRTKCFATIEPLFNGLRMRLSLLASPHLPGWQWCVSAGSSFGDAEVGVYPEGWVAFAAGFGSNSGSLIAGIQSGNLTGTLPIVATNYFLQCVAAARPWLASSRLPRALFSNGRCAPFTDAVDLAGPLSHSRIIKEKEA